MSLLDLYQQKNLRIRYLQVDSKHKCIPTDWFFGYDTFAIYSFFQLSRSSGFFRNLENNKFVEFNNDFHSIYGIISFLFFKTKLVISTLYDLIILLCVVYAISIVLQEIIL
jgi:hypothetical protein